MKDQRDAGGTASAAPGNANVADAEPRDPQNAEIRDRLMGRLAADPDAERIKAAPVEALTEAGLPPEAAADYLSEETEVEGHMMRVDAFSDECCEEGDTTADPNTP